MVDGLVMWNLTAVAAQTNINAVAQEPLALCAVAATSYDFQIVVDPNS